MKRFRLFIFLTAASSTLISCSLNKQLSREIKIQKDTVFAHAWVGLSLYDEQKGNYIYGYNESGYFTPASNTKLFTCYAAMKHLPDSLPGWYKYETSDTLYLKPNGDPTFMDVNFKNQVVFDVLKRQAKPVLLVRPNTSQMRRLGFGWAWNNFQEFYMPEKSAMPIYGNVIRFAANQQGVSVFPSYFQQQFNGDGVDFKKKINIRRAEDTNQFTATQATSNYLTRPFTQKQDTDLTYRLLSDTLAKSPGTKSLNFAADGIAISGWKPWYTQKTDSVLKYMMHNSDNFIAEQTLLMVGSQLSGNLNDSGTIDKLLKSDYSQLPDKPKWVDGSGLSRNNLFSPRDMIALLNKMKTDFSWNRISSILPHGNQGTLLGYYKGYEQNIWAKTGTLSGHIALSGYLITKKGNRYTFSFLVNNHQAAQVQVKKSIEKILTQIIDLH